MRLVGKVAVSLEADTVSFEHEEIDLGRVALDKVMPVSGRLIAHSKSTVIPSQATAELVMNARFG